MEPSVKILHLRMNPLDMAHQEYKEFRAGKKREMVFLNRSCFHQFL